MVEIDQALESEDNILCVAITFNRRWSIPDEEKTLTKRPTVNYALAIVARIISMYYRMSFNIISTKIRMADLSFAIDRADTSKDPTPILLIRETVKLIVSQAIAAGHPIRKFVLLVDEARRAEDEFGEKVHDILRAALLDVYIIDRLDVRLGMSSLNISSAGVTDSNRSIKVIRTPDFLPPAAVFEQWMMKWVNTTAETNNVEAFNATDSVKLKLMSLIAVMCRLPRALEILIEAFAGIYVTHMSKSANPPPFALDSDTVEELLQLVIEEMRTRYRSMSKHVFEPRYAKALLFHEEIPVDDYVMARIVHSQFTNSIDAIYTGSSITPETTAMCFHLMPDDLAISYEYATMLKQITRDLLAYIATSKGVEDAGRPLEIVTRGIINARLGVMMDLHNADEKYKSAMKLNSLLLARTRGITADDDTKTRWNTPIVFSGADIEALHSLEIPVSYPNQQGDKEPRKCLSSYFFLCTSFIHLSIHLAFFSFLNPSCDCSEHIEGFSRCHQRCQLPKLQSRCLHRTTAGPV